ncbi:MAG: hypothetical protein ACRELD_00180 [Longimicrobiales bacterium]
MSDAGPGDIAASDPDPARRGLRLLRRTLGLAIVATAFVFLGLTIARDWDRLRPFAWSVQPLRLVASLVAIEATFVFGVYVWSRTLRCFAGEPVRWRALLRIWFLANLVRYIPGKVWQFVGIAELARRAGLEPARLLTSLFIQTGIVVLAAAVVGIGTAPADAWLDASVRPTLLLGALGLATACVHPAALNFGLRLIPRWVHRSTLVWQGTWKEGIWLLVLAAIDWLAYGFALWLFVSSITPLPGEALAALTGINALAFLVGYLVFIAPAGLGARELSMTALLAPLLPVASVAAVVAIASRLWVIAAELAGAAAMLLATRARATKT